MFLFWLFIKIIKMEYFYRDFNIPCFNFNGMEKQIKLYGNREFKNEKEIAVEQKKYKNKKEKAYVLGFVDNKLAEEITGVNYPLFVVALHYYYFFTFPDGYVVVY